ncbi:MAG: nitrophenyl compound nitroreductase subunit ArsF family protein [Proteobacteria bacterium]|nr:nitrophenyl compound nitroreductase subunit ArsF family protein [Pseudomonadota bacterium]
MKVKIILLAVLMSFTAYAKTAKVEAENKTPQTTIVNVYYFHGKFRCPTCRNMESYSRETVEKYFKKEIESGKVNFKAIDVEEKGNEHYVNDYKLYTKTLIVSATKNGKEIQYKNLDKIWEYSRDKQKFMDYVKNEIAGYLRTK